MIAPSKALKVPILPKYEVLIHAPQPELLFEVFTRRRAEGKHQPLLRAASALPYRSKPPL